MSIIEKSLALAENQARREDEERDFARLRPALYDYVKRFFDIVISLLLLTATGPLIVLLAGLIKLTSRGPAFYTQIRLGLGGQPFTVHKLRTMVHNCESFSGPKWSIPGDPRITRLGRILRKTHVDELPQLWDILRGKMSLVGPRPERTEFIPRLAQSIPYYRHRLLVRPGLTGLAQVQLPPDSDLASVGRKLGYDLYYIRHGTLWLDIRIILGTIFHVLGLAASLSQDFFDLPSREVVERGYLEIVQRKRRASMRTGVRPAAAAKQSAPGLSAP